MKKIFHIIAVGIVFSIGASVFAAAPKITIPDQAPYPIVEADNWRAKVLRSIFDDANEKAVIKFQMGYAIGGSGFNEISSWKDRLKYKNVVDNPETPEDETSTDFDDCKAAYQTNTSTYKAWLEANLPAGWPDPQ